ncbi:MAG TPA: glycosyltransferase [Bryobacteraceae bacterium]|nr:glycosyltransferase [Bryobacteraceae bacterium]
MHRIDPSNRISVVLIAHNEGLNLRLTVENLQNTLPPNHEIVVIDDRSSDGSADFLAGATGSVRLVRSGRRLGVAGARNYGTNQTDGDVIVFCDAHLSFPGGWCRPLLSLLEDPLIGAAAPCISDREARRHKGFGLRPSGPDLNAEWLGRKGNDPYPVPLLPGACMAMRRDLFRAVGGFDGNLIRYGVEDCELSLRLWLLGYELWLVPAVDVEHEFHDRIPYKVDWRTVLHNRLRMAFLHFSSSRLGRVLDALTEYPDFAAALDLVTRSDAALQRSELESRRRHDDDWFFQKFGLNW